MKRNTALQTKNGRKRARTVMQSFRLAPSERAELHAVARAGGVSVSDYLRGLVRVHLRRAAK